MPTRVTPTIERVTVEPSAHTPGCWTVRTHWTGVDRPSTHGISVDKPALADRLAAAMRAGVVYIDPEVATDVNGQTYVDARCKVMGKYLNADLHRLGF